MFKDVRKLTKQAGELRETYSVQDQISHMSQVMAQGQQTLASMAAGGAGGLGADGAMQNGVDAVATITASRQTGMLVNHNPVIELDLLVMHGGVPTPTTCRQVVQMLHLSRAQVGSQVTVKVDPANPASVWIDWENPV